MNNSPPFKMDRIAASIAAIPPGRKSPETPQPAHVGQVEETPPSETASPALAAEPLADDNGDDSETIFPFAHRHERAALVKTIGARMREARELNNLSQQVAARRLGFARASDLARVESAADIDSIPAWLIRRAADCYNVTVDYLFGFVQDWDIGGRAAQEREVSGWLFREMDQARRQYLEEMARLDRRIAALGQMIPALLTDVEEVTHALGRVRALNQAFDEDMRGSARLADAVEKLGATAADANAALRRCKFVTGNPADLNQSAEAGKTHETPVFSG